ncbi:ribonuclease H-like domain-containing protein [Mycena sanguinolenta]|nr:ribonuclease H-like domain-containing protein [Mycena sanguinolenta]
MVEANQSSLDLEPFRAAGKKKSAEQKEAFQKIADHRIMVLICKCGLVPDLLDREEWAEFVNHLNPTYIPTSAKKFTHEYIPQEAALVRQKTKEALQNSRDLTYTFDGTSIRRGDSFYTSHACTPKRDIYFLGGHFGSKESHNAEWIENGAVETMNDIGSELWAAAGSDSTRVTLASRRGIVEKLPAVLDICDVVHFTQHLIGDVNELPEFKLMMGTMKPLLRHFSKSGNSKAHLKDSGVGMAEDGGDQQIRMLAKIGGTRFATHFMAASTIEPVLRNIQDLVLNGKIKFKVSLFLQAVFGDRYSLQFPTFAKDLLTYQTVVAPMARSLWSLEATTANAADALIFWLAIASVLESFFEKPEEKTGLSSQLAQHVRAIFNARYSEFFGHSDVYFVALCLDPRTSYHKTLPNSCAGYPNSEFLRERLPKRVEGVEEYIPFPHAFLRVKTFLRDMLKSLVDEHHRHTDKSKCLCHPILKTKSSSQLIIECKSQLNAFWLGEPPFHSPVIDGDSMEWWENLQHGQSPRSAVLAMLGVRIFGILVNSMPDERTNSNITWFNSPLRGNQAPERLVDMITVGQWYTYHAKGATGHRRRPRRPTVAFRRLDTDTLEKIKMEARTIDDSSSESDSEDDESLGDASKQQELELLRSQIEAIKGKKQPRKKKGQSRTFPSHPMFVVDVDVNPNAPGLKAMLVDGEDEIEEHLESSEPEPAEGLLDVSWDDW